MNADDLFEEVGLARERTHSPANPVEEVRRIDQTVRRLVRVVQSRFAMVREAFRNLDARVNEHEDAIKALNQARVAQAGRLTELEARVTTLEGGT